jgi:hypothetical protein
MDSRCRDPDGRVESAKLPHSPFSERIAETGIRSMKEKELRLALVCYGGVSFALYMHE